jgi:hypothetical protein
MDGFQRRLAEDIQFTSATGKGIAQIGKKGLEPFTFHLMNHLKGDFGNYQTQGAYCWLFKASIQISL